MLDILAKPAGGLADEVICTTGSDVIEFVLATQVG
jgi:hypothetical protein